MGVEPADHPLFFLSYARPRVAASNKEVSAFFDELVELVSEMAGLQAGEVPGFMDTSIMPGREWDQELLTAVGTCKVFVALMSPRYFTSEWCAMEWHAFERRRVHGASAAERAMLSVIWTPFESEKVPAKIQRVQRFSPEADPQIVRGYRKDGVRGMGFMRADGYSGYQTVLWRLAGRIVEISQSHTVDELVPTRDELRKTFEGPDA